MEKTNKTFAQRLIMVLALVLFLGAHGYSNDKDNGRINTEPAKIKNVYAASALNHKVSDKFSRPSVSKTVMLPVEVKNIWKDMPGYDRYGNEITARARLNM